MTFSPAASTSRPSISVPDDALYFLPLGGAGEIGMNMYLYGHDGHWLMVDCGVTFADDSVPGVDLIVPDPAFIERRRDALVGMVITHAHEDHIGAVTQLWTDLRCPIYATPFTAAVLRIKLRETDFADQVKIIEVPLGGDVQIGPFGVGFITMTHSVPEPSALVIRTKHGNIIHTGDWKLDPSPQIGAPYDEAKLRRLGDEGVVAVMGDSTNALTPGRSGSEEEVREGLARVIAAQPNRVVVTCFSSNVARIHSVVLAAQAAGRHCALVGRSLWKIMEAAQSTGYMTKLPEPFIREDQFGYIPRDKIVLICTGSQGEPRSALSRIAGDSHPHITLEAGDTVIFSAREIPGNEKAIGRVQNALVAQGVTLLTPDDEMVHCSGHPSRDELVSLYQWLKPQIVIPVHGEERHMQAHAALARDCQVSQTLVPHNGALIRLAPGPAEIVDNVEHGKLALDGHHLVPLDGEAIRDRQRIIHNGAAVITLVLDRDGRLAADPKVALLGIEDAEDLAESEAEVAEEVRGAIQNLPRAQRNDDSAISETARVTVRRTIRSWHGKKPVTEVHLIRL
jgi:ribonuclease J